VACIGAERHVPYIILGQHHYHYYGNSAEARQRTRERSFVCVQA